MTPLIHTMILAASLLAQPAAEAPTATAPDARSLLEQGLALQKKAQYDRALEIFREATALDAPRSVKAKVRVELAETLFRKGQAASSGKVEGVDHEAVLGRARSRFSAIAKEYADVPDQAAIAAYMIGSCDILLDDMDRALAAYTKAYFDYPESRYRPRALMRIGVCLAGTGQAEKARGVFRVFLREYPDASKVEGISGNDLDKVRKYIYQLQIVGRKAPPLKADEWLLGTLSEGLEDLRGDVVVVVFFATWCKNCENELPHLKREIATWSARGVSFVGVTDPTDPKTTVPPDFYVRDNRLEFTDVAIDRGGKSWRQYRVTGMPAAAIIDRRGTVRWRGHFAFLSGTLLKRLLED